MKTTLSILLITIHLPISGFAEKIRIVPPPVPSVPAPISRPAFNNPNVAGEHVRLLDGSVFKGSFKGFNENGELLWEHPGVSPIAIQPAALAKLTLTRNAKTAKNHSSVAHLINGDRLTGDLKKLDDKGLMINTWYAGALTIDRHTIQALTPGIIGGESLYAGPTAEDQKSWKYTNNGSYKWTFKDGGFQSNGSSANVGRMVKDMPKSVKMEFEYQWQSGSPSLYISLLSDNLASYSAGNCYSIRISSTSMYVYRYSRINGGLSSSRLTPSSVSHRLNRTRLRSHVALCVDTTKKTLAVIVDGKLVGTFRDNSGRDMDALGKGFAFHSRSSIPARISNVRVTKWDGGLPSGGTTSSVALKQDYVKFNNDDSFSGNLVGITDGTLKFKTEFAELPIPLNTVSQLHFAKERLKNPAISAKAIRATLVDDIKVTGTIKEWKDGEVTLASPVFGEATFKADAFKIIEFNLGKPRNSASINTKPQNSVIDRAHAIRAAQEARVPAQVAEGIAQELEILREQKGKFKLNIRRK